MENFLFISPVGKTPSKRTPEIGLRSTLGIQCWEKKPCGILRQSSRVFPTGGDGGSSPTSRKFGHSPTTRKISPSRFPPPEILEDPE